MSKSGKPRTTYNQFAIKVAARTGYFVYEIKDILKAMAAEAYTQLKEEGRASILGIGTIYTKKKKPTVLKVPDKMGGMQEIQVPEKTRVLFKISDAVKEFIEPNYKGKDHYKRYKKKCQK